MFKPSRGHLKDTCLFLKQSNYLSNSMPALELNTTVNFAGAEAMGTFGNFKDSENRAPSFNKRLAVFFVAAIVAIIFSVTAIVLKAKFSYAPRIGGLELSEFNFKNFAPIDKEAFLARLSGGSRNRVNSQVHYVYQLIGDSKLSKKEAKHLAEVIVLESLRAGYDPLFVTAVIKSESTFDRNAVSFAGARGLMQIMPDTGRFVSRLNNVEWNGSGKLLDPEYNIRLGIAYLKHLEEAFDGNKELMLIAYNWGPQNVVDSLRNLKRVPASCLSYAKTIMGNHTDWNAHFTKNMAQFKYMDLEFLS